MYMFYFYWKLSLLFWHACIRSIFFLIKIQNYCLLCKCCRLFCVVSCVRLGWFYVVTRCFHPRHNGLWHRRISIQENIHYFLSYINSWERASISLLMLRAKQGNYWYHFYIVFGMTRSLIGDSIRDLLNSKPALYH